MSGDSGRDCQGWRPATGATTRIRRGERSFLAVIGIVFVGSVLAASSLAYAESRRLLDATELQILGVALSAAPLSQVVPVNVPTIVSVPLVAAGDPTVVVPVGELPATMRVKAELSGPGLSSIALEAAPGSELAIPALANVGTYVVDNIRLVDGTTLLFSAEPRSVEIVVQDILISAVTSRPLSVDELEARGIVIDERNFKVLNFTVSLGFGSEQIQIDIPTLIPNGGGPPVPIPKVFHPLDIGPAADLPPATSSITQPPDIVPFTLEAPDEFDAVIPPSVGITAAMVFPQAVGFLNQFHSVVLMVTNAAPETSGLEIRNLEAVYHLPSGRLARVRTTPATIGEAPVPVRVPGPDGQLGTADDLLVIAAGVTASNELVTEGLEEGTHVINVDLSGTITGLPIGDVPITGRAAGVVLVRNPVFNLTFLVPSVVESGQEFELSATITNTSDTIANLVSLTLPRSSVAGAVLLSDERLQFQTVEAGESATATYRLRSLRSGQLMATRFSTAADNLRGQFQVGLSINEDGVPTSPDTITLPAVAYNLPDDLVGSLVSFLGTAWSNATSTPDMLPPGMPQIGRDAVRRAAVQIADAGQRMELGEPAMSALGHLMLRFAGSEGGSTALDTVRRGSLRWPDAEQAFAAALGAELDVVDEPPSFLATELATAHFYLAPMLLAALDDAQGTARLMVEDHAMRRLGGGDDERGIATGVRLQLADRGELAAVAAPSGAHTVTVEAVVDGVVGLTLVVPRALVGGDVELRRVEFSAISLLAGQRAEVTFDETSQAYNLLVGGAPYGGTVVDELISAPTLQVVAAWVAQSINHDHRVVSVLFNRPVDEGTATLPTRYRFTGAVARDQGVASVQLQSSGRFAFLSLYNPVPPTPDTTLTVSGISDRDGAVMTPQDVVIEVPETTDWGVVDGTAFDGLGRAIPGVSVYLSETRRTSFGGNFVTRTTARSTTDESGRFSFPFVRASDRAFELYAYYGPQSERASVIGRVRVEGDRLDLALRFLGRGRITGRAVNGAGAAMNNVLATGFGTTQRDFDQDWTDATGRFQLEGLPVGAVNLSLDTTTGEAAARSVVIPSAGAEVDVGDVTLQSLGSRVVRGRVTSNGAALIGAPVVVSSDRTQPPWGTWMRSDSDGNYVFADVPAEADTEITVYVLDPASNLECARVSGHVDGGNDFVRDLYCTSIASGGVGTVDGIVLSSGGVPLTGATVFLGGEQATTTVGEFTFSDVALGGGTVYALYGNRLANGSYSLDFDGQTAAVTIRMPALGDLTVEVVADGAPVHAAIVRLGGSIHGCETLPDGTCLLEDIDIGTYNVAALFDQSLAGGAVVRRVNSTTASLRFDGDATTVTVVLPPLATLSGVTYEHSDTPPNSVLGGALVRLRALGASSDGWPVGFDYPAVRSDATTGEFEFRNIPESFFTLEADHPFITTVARMTGTLSGSTSPVDLVFPAEGSTLTATVTVLDPAGTPIADADADLSVALRTDDAPDALTIEGENPALYPGLGAGRFVIDATYARAGLPSWVGCQAYSAVSDTSVSIRLLGHGTVTGRVFDGDGVPVPEVDLRLRAAGLANDIQELTMTSADGSFVFTDVREGPVTLTATHTSGSGSATAAVGHGGTVDLEVRFAPTATVAGIVKRPDGITPATGIPVVLKQLVRRFGGGWTWVYWDGATTCPDANCGGAGTFTLGPVPYDANGGTLYRVFTSDPLTGRGALEDVVVAGDVSGMTLRLGAVGSVTGRVVDSDGVTPIVNTTVTLQGGTANPELGGITLTTEVDGFGGNYRFEGVGEGPFVAFASKPSTVLEARGSGEIDSEGDVARLDLVLEPHGSISGRVLSEQSPDNWVAIAGAIVRARGARGYDQYDQTQGDDGAFLFRHVPLGDYWLDAVVPDPLNEGKPDIAAAAGTITQDGEVATEDLRLAGYAQLTVDVDGGADYDVSVSHAIQELDTEAPYEFGRVRRGPISAAALLPGLPTQGSVTSFIPPGSFEHQVTIPVGPVVAVTGNVVATDGTTLVAEAIVELWSDGDHFSLRSAADGSFAFPYVSAQGELRVDARTLDGSQRARVRHSWGATPVDQQLTLQLDSHGPTLLTSVPAPNATVPLSLQQITLTFSEAMDPPSFAGANLRFNGQPVASAVVVGDTVTVGVTGPLESSAPQTLLIRGAVEDHNGVRLGSDTLVRFSTIDDDPPTALFENPVDGASGVLVATQVRVLFSEPMDGATFAGKVFMTCDGNAQGDLTIDASGLRAVTPTSQLLPADAACVVHVDDVADLAGNLHIPVTFNFETEDTVDPVLAGIAVTAPIGQSDYAERSTVEVAATADAGTDDVVTIDYYIQGPTMTRRSIGTGYPTTAPPFAISFDVPTLAEVGGATLTVVAIAVDDGGNSSAEVSMPLAISVDLPPTVSVELPTNPQYSVGTTIPIRIAAVDSYGLGSISYFVSGLAEDTAQITFSEGTLSGVLEGEVPTDAYGSGTIVIHGQATDESGQTAATTPFVVTLIETSVVGVVLLPDGNPAPGVRVDVTDSLDVTRTGYSQPNGGFAVGTAIGAFTARFHEESTGRRARREGTVAVVGQHPLGNVTLTGAVTVDVATSIGDYPLLGPARMYVKLPYEDEYLGGEFATGAAFTLGGIAGDFEWLRLESVISGTTSPNWLSPGAQADGAILNVAVELPSPTIATASVSIVTAGETTPLSMTGVGWVDGVTAELIYVLGAPGASQPTTFAAPGTIDVDVTAEDSGPIALVLYNPDGGRATWEVLSDPRLLGSLQSEWASQLAAIDDTVYVTGVGVRAHLIDRVSGTWSDLGAASVQNSYGRLALTDNWLFAATSTGGDQVHVFDISNRSAAPVYLATSGPIGSPRALVSVAPEEIWVLIDNRFERLRVQGNDLVVDPQPVYVGGQSYLAQVSGPFLFTGGASPIRMFDVSDPERPALLASYVGSHNELAVVGTRVFALQNNRTTLDILDFSEPHQVQLVASVPLGITASDIVLHDGGVLLPGYVGGSGRIARVDMTDFAVSTLVRPRSGTILLHRGFLFESTVTPPGVDVSYEASVPPTPTLRDVLRPATPVAGGSVLTVVGEDLEQGAIVELGDGSTWVAATGVFVGRDWLSATAPAGSAGSLTVRVTNPLGASEQLNDALERTDAPRLFGFRPATHSPLGGRLITLDGTGLDAVTSVLIDGGSNPVSMATVPAPSGQVGDVADVSLPGDDPVALRLRTSEHLVDNRWEGPLMSAATSLSASYLASGAMLVATDNELFRVESDGRITGYDASGGMVAGNLLLTDGGLLYDATDPDSLQTLGTLSWPWGGSSRFVGDRVYSSLFGCVHDISVPSSPQLRGCGGNLGSDFAAFDGGVLWLEDVGGVRRLRTIDYRIPALPRETSVTGMPATGPLTVSGRRALFAGTDPATSQVALYWLDLDDLTLAGLHGPYAPVVGAAAHPTLAPVVVGDEVWIATQSDGLRGFERQGTDYVANGEFAVGEAVQSLASSGGRILAGLGSGSVYVYKTTASSMSPVVVSVTPDSGPTVGGAVVRIAGSGFVAGSTLWFGGAEAPSVQFLNANELRATAPAGSGVVDVRVVDPLAREGTLSNAFSYQASPPPTISEVSPSSGPRDGNITVSIHGWALDGVTAVSFEQLGSPAAVAVIGATTPTRVDVTLPSAPASVRGLADVVLETAAGTDRLIDGFLYDADVLQASNGSGSITACSGVLYFSATGVARSYDLDAILAGASALIETASFAVPSSLDACGRGYGIGGQKLFSPSGAEVGHVDELLTRRAVFHDRLYGLDGDTLHAYDLPATVSGLLVPAFSSALSSSGGEPFLADGDLVYAPYAPTAEAVEPWLFDVSGSAARPLRKLPGISQLDERTAVLSTGGTLEIGNLVNPTATSGGWADAGVGRIALSADRSRVFVAAAGQMLEVWERDPGNPSWRRVETRWMPVSFNRFLVYGDLIILDNGPTVLRYGIPTALEVTSIEPSAGPTRGGQRVRIRGTGLGSATAVTIDGVSRAFEVLSPSELQVTTQLHTSGTVDVVVSGGLGSGTASYTYRGLESMFMTSGGVFIGAPLTVVLDAPVDLATAVVLVDGAPNASVEVSGRVVSTLVKRDYLGVVPLQLTVDGEQVGLTEPFVLTEWMWSIGTAIQLALGTQGTAFISPEAESWFREGERPPGSSHERSSSERSAAIDNLNLTAVDLSDLNAVGEVVAVSETGDPSFLGPIAVVSDLELLIGGVDGHMQVYPYEPLTSPLTSQASLNDSYGTSYHYDVAGTRLLYLAEGGTRGDLRMVDIGADLTSLSDLGSTGFVASSFEWRDGAALLANTLDGATPVPLQWIAVGLDPANATAGVSWAPPSGDWRILQMTLSGERVFAVARESSAASTWLLVLDASTLTLQHQVDITSDYDYDVSLTFPDFWVPTRTFVRYGDRLWVGYPGQTSVGELVAFDLAPLAQSPEQPPLRSAGLDYGSYANAVTARDGVLFAAYWNSITGFPIGGRAVDVLAPFPAQGAEDTLVTLSGWGFDPDANVTFDGIPAREVRVDGPNKLKCRPPAGIAQGASQVVVTNPTSGLQSAAQTFTVQ